MDYQRDEGVARGALIPMLGPEGLSQFILSELGYNVMAGFLGSHFLCENMKCW
jgi:hypothetical protein